MRHSASPQPTIKTQPAEACQLGKPLVYADPEGAQIVKSPEFQSEWKLLTNRGPWSTAFQTPEFACTWYLCYEEIYRPWLLVRYAARGEMEGLLAFGVDKTAGESSCAGAQQAEYRVWLEMSGGNDFVTEAPQRLRQLEFRRLDFTYLEDEVAPVTIENVGFQYQNSLETSARFGITATRTF